MKVLATPRSFGKNNPELFDILRDAGLDVVRNDPGGILSADRMCEKLADCDGLIVGVDPVDATVLAAAPRLRAIAKYGVGLDNIDLAACEARGIKVSRTVGANSEAVADYALALMLGVARKVALIDRRCRERDWSKITGIDLYGKTVGIIGLGAIGKRVARRCGAGFGMKVLGTTSSGTTPGPARTMWSAPIWNASSAKPTSSACTPASTTAPATWWMPRVWPS